MSVVCVGGMSVFEITALFETIPFTQWIPGTRTPLPKIQEQVGKYTERRKEVSSKERNPNTNRTACKFITKVLIPGTIHPDVVGHTSSLLGKKITRELREIRGWVYDVDVSFLNIQGTYYVLTILCDGVDPSVVDQVKDLIDVTIGSLHQSETEFHEMRQSIRAGHMYFDPTIDGIADGIITDLVTYQRIQTIAERRAAFEDV